MPASLMRRIAAISCSHLLAVQAGGRLVEHQQLGLAHQRAGDLEDAPLAGGQGAGREFA